ncbi:MAG: branched-chain-amino-acid transaminase [Spirochaetes bacterium]|nr:branched-chain-amino-acid transaminase [Spirochaetota bacterium]
MAFTLNSFPVVYKAKFENDGWKGEFVEKPHKTPQEEAQMPGAEREALVESRNFYSDLPLVNYSTQYGNSCFEGLKAFPQKDGGLAIFRPEQNAARFARSMKGLYMPAFPEGDFVQAVAETVKKNAALGFCVGYDAQWEKDSFASALSVYIRPFTFSEAGFTPEVSREPWVFVVTMPMSAYFSSENANAVVTDRIRATPKGTGWIKTASNYVISTLAKHEARQQGFTECIFLDAANRRFVEEGSSCNIFFYLKSGELVSPALGDTVLPGITRASIVELARDRGINVCEREISIEEALGETAECFVCGTAAGVTPIGSLSHNGKKTAFNDGKTGDVTAQVRDTLKGIQYGTVPDAKGWMLKVL